MTTTLSGWLIFHLRLWVNDDIQNGSNSEGDDNDGARPICSQLKKGGNLGEEDEGEEEEGEEEEGEGPEGEGSER